jgi:predicted acetyltransferase
MTQTIRTTVEREIADRFKIERVVDGKPVSGLTVWDLQMRVGCAQVRMAGIGGVWTDPEHRKRGHSRAVLERLLDFMVEEGFDVSLLFGITDYYPRWGYATVMADGTYRLVIPAESAQRAASDLVVREMRREADMSQVLAIYDTVSALRTGSVVRQATSGPRPLHKGTRWDTQVTVMVVEDGEGEIIGYVAYDSVKSGDEDERTPILDRVDVAEVAATDERAYGAILAYLGRLAGERCAPSINVHIPPDDPFALHCRSFGVEQHAGSQADGGAMMRIVNLDSFLRKIELELSRRVAGRGLSASLGIATDIGAAELRIDGTGVRVADKSPTPDFALELEQWKLLQLVTGYRTLADVLSDPRDKAFPPGGQIARKIGIPPGLQAVCTALFPLQWAYCWQSDRF